MPSFTFRPPPRQPWIRVKPNLVELVPPTIVPATTSGPAAMAFSLGTPSGSVATVIPPAPWLSGIVGQFFVEGYTLTLVPGQIVTVDITLFDQEQGSVA